MLMTARFGTRDLDRARAFYDAIAEILDAKRVLDRPEAAGYRSANGGMFMIGRPFEGEATAGNGVQAAFNAPSRAAVSAAHAKALELGGSCAGAPGFRGPEEMNFYAAYFRDPDGNKVMVAKSGPE